MPQGQLLYIMDNASSLSRIRADGLDWYWVTRWPADGDQVAGYVASGDRGVTYLELVPVVCGDQSAPTIGSVMRMTPYARLVCLRGRDLTLVGTVVTGFGGLPAPGTYEPHWLAYPFGSFGAMQDAQHVIFYFWLPPGLSHPSVDTDGTRLRVTGHFADPIADTCIIIPYGAHSSDPPVAHWLCQEKFVATQIVLASQ